MIAWYYVLFIFIAGGIGGYVIGRMSAKHNWWS
jgi:hypothetical protein